MDATADDALGWFATDLTEANWTRYAPENWVVPGGAFTQFASDGRELDVRLRMDVVGGRLEVTGLMVEPKPANAPLRRRDLEGVQLRRLVRLARRTGVRRNARAQEIRAQQGQGHPGQRGYGPEHWKLVAEIYQLARQEAPEQPTKATAEALGKPDSTIRRWLAECRKRGLLPSENER